MPHRDDEFQQLAQEHVVLLKCFASLQRRCSEQQQALLSELSRLQALVVRLRAELMLHTSVWAWAKEVAPQGHSAQGVKETHGQRRPKAQANAEVNRASTKRSPEAADQPSTGLPVLQGMVKRSQHASAALLVQAEAALHMAARTAAVYMAGAAWSGSAHGAAVNAQVPNALPTPEGTHAVHGSNSAHLAHSAHAPYTASTANTPAMAANLLASKSCPALTAKKQAQPSQVLPASPLLPSAKPQAPVPQSAVPQATGDADVTTSRTWTQPKQQPALVATTATFALASQAQVPAHDASSWRQADWVICQTGCISDGDHWRADDQCRRTGKTCLQVDAPDAVLRLDGAPAGDAAVPSTQSNAAVFAQPSATAAAAPALPALANGLPLAAASVSHGVTHSSAQGPMPIVRKAIAEPATDAVSQPSLVR